MEKLPLDEDQNTVWMRMLYNEARGVFLNFVIMMKRTDHLNLLNMISLSITVTGRNLARSKLGTEVRWMAGIYSCAVCVICYSTM